MVMISGFIGPVTDENINVGVPDAEAGRRDRAGMM